MRTLLVAFLLALAPSLASAAEVERHELASGRSYFTYRPKGLPDAPLVLMWLSPEKGGAKAAAEAWQEKFGAIPALVVFPSYDGKGWKAYDWEVQKIVKDRELAYLQDCLDDVEKASRLPRKRAVVAGWAQGGDYAFELGLRFPERFVGSIPIVPAWCAHNKFERNARTQRIYFLVGAEDKRKPNAFDAYERLRKHGSDMIWRPIAGLGHDLPEAAELERAVRWQREQLDAPTDATLSWALSEWESGSQAVGIHLLEKLTKAPKLAEHAKKVLASIEKQAKKELDQATRKPKYEQIEELWRLYDRYGPVAKVHDAIKKALADVGGELGAAEAPPAEKEAPAAPGSDEATGKILDLGDQAQLERAKGEYDKAVASIGEMLSLIDKAELGAGEKQTLELSARFDLARVYALQGKKQAAIAELEKALDLGYDDWKALEAEHDLDSLREEPGFRALMNRRER